MEWLEKLKKLKESTNETYRSISEKTKIPQTTIEKLFTGRTKDPKLTIIRSIVHCLGYTLDDVAGDDNEKHNQVKDIYTSHQKKVIKAYIAQPEMQPAVDKILGIEEKKTVAEDIKNTVEQINTVFSKSTTIK